MSLSLGLESTSGPAFCVTLRSPLTTLSLTFSFCEMGRLFSLAEGGC